MLAALGSSSHSCPKGSQGMAIPAGPAEGSPKQKGFAGCSLDLAGNVASKAAIQIIPSSALCSGHCAGMQFSQHLVHIASYSFLFLFLP